MALILTDIQKVALTVSAVDAAGNPAQIENVSWQSSNVDILTVAVEQSDDKKAVATTVGPLGTAQIQVTADARIGEGVVELTGVLDVEVVASEATTLSIVPGTPESRI